MTLFFSGHNFKYELEGIVKLFFPVVRFRHVYDEINPTENSYVLTRRKRGKSNTYLWVRVKLGKQTCHESFIISNNIEQYEKECERLLAILLYQVLSKMTGILPRWGILTGIRPVATIQKLRRQGQSDETIAAYLKEQYLVTDEKIQLAFLTADTQQQMLQQVSDNSYSLYISIPFCTSRCSYCSFVSHAISTKKSMEKVDDYVPLLCEEISYTAKIAMELGWTLETIYIGGGTPTALSASQLKKITDTISKHFDISIAKEYTIEAGRADTITREKLEVIKQAGATRISVNPQTFNDDVLKAIGRKHSAQQVKDSYLLAKEVGFDSINMDFIAGLPTDTIESFQNSIDTAIALSPSNITVHTLSIKRSADLFQETPAISADCTTEMTDYAQKKLIKSGYFPYYLYRQKNTLGNLENVGYSKKGYESLYNIFIMDETQTILACGAGGATKLVRQPVSKYEKYVIDAKPIARIFNYKYHFEYINHFDEIIKRKAEVKTFYEKEPLKQQN